jgi:hypothetical protein
VTEIEFGIPGEVNFSYIHIKGTPEELGRVNYEMLGALFASAMYTTKSGEKDAIKRLQQGLTALLPASEVTTEELPQEEAEKLLKGELGAQEVDPNEAPYKQPPPAAAKKPWEQDKPKATAKVDVSDW